MSALINKLAQLESRLQSLVEGNVARLFPASPLPHDLAVRLMDALRAGVEAGPGGLWYAPNHFIIFAHPRLANALQSSPDLLDGLVRALRDAGLESGLRFASLPDLQIVSAPGLPAGEIRVSAENDLGDISQTLDMPLDHVENQAPPDAFLIVDGVQVFSLNQSVVNIGRQSGNQLVIDDPRVSRLHAQLRAVNGRYVIFDLDSRGGTWVNGQRVQHCLLHPGDVISLSGVPLVFGQEAIAPGETQELPPMI